MVSTESGELVYSFLYDFSAAVVSGDINSTLKHFDKNVLSFGTRAVVCCNLEELVSEQWSKIWGKCKTWEISSIDALDANSALGFVAFRWKRVSLEGSEQTGRSTLVFKITETTVCVLHSHFSEDSLINSFESVI